MAEIPTFQEMQDSGLVAQPDDPSATPYRDRKVEEWRQGLVLRVSEQTLTLSPRSSELTFPAGAGGLPTLRLAVVYEAPLRFESGVLVYEDRNYPQRVGWKEIVASAYDGANLTRSSVPGESKSQQLTNYATDLCKRHHKICRAELMFSIPTTAHAQVSSTSPATETDSDKRSRIANPAELADRAHYRTTAHSRSYCPITVSCNGIRRFACP